MNKTDTILTAAAEPDRQAIREQLDRVLSSPHFSHSKRYPAFLHYIVGQALSGKAEDIKERAIGIEVFQRDADYETNTDPIVRVTAGAIRRRLQQYYYEPDHERELHIELPSGSYVPVFRVPDEAATPRLASGSARKASHSRLRLGPPWVRYAAAAALAAVLISSSFSYKQEAANNPLNQFWSPLLASGQPMLLCVANARENDFGENVSLPDMLTMTQVENALKARKRSYEVVDVSTIDPRQRGSGPVVFVVPYHNKWAVQLTQGLRYTFDVTENPNAAPGSPKLEGAIRDNFSQTEWRNDHSGIHDHNYAIVARFLDKSLGRSVVLISGLGPAGTTSAGQVLTDAKFTDLLASRAPTDWQKENLEAVIRTEADNHQPGPPAIEAAYFWQ